VNGEDATQKELKDILELRDELLKSEEEGEEMQLRKN